MSISRKTLFDIAFFSKQYADRDLTLSGETYDKYKFSLSDINSSDRIAAADYAVRQLNNKNLLKYALDHKENTITIESDEPLMMGEEEGANDEKYTVKEFKAKMTKEKKEEQERIAIRNQKKIGLYAALKAKVDSRGFWSKLFHPIRTYKESSLLSTIKEDIATSMPDLKPEVLNSIVSTVQDNYKLKNADFIRDDGKLESKDDLEYEDLEGMDKLGIEYSDEDLTVDAIDQREKEGIKKVKATVKKKDFYRTELGLKEDREIDKLDKENDITSIIKESKEEVIDEKDLVDQLKKDSTIDESSTKKSETSKIENKPHVLNK